MPLFFLLGVFVEPSRASSSGLFAGPSLASRPFAAGHHTLALSSSVWSTHGFDIRRYVISAADIAQRYLSCWRMLIVTTSSFVSLQKILFSLFCPLRELWWCVGQLVLVWPVYALGVVLGGKLAAVHYGVVARGTLWLVCANDARTAGYPYWSDVTIPAAIAGTVACLAIANIPQLARNRVLLLLGRRSLAIFLLHVLFVAGTRIVLQKVLGVAEPALILLLAVTAGVVGPLLIRALVARLNLLRPLGLS
jgi:peptidoglycan/LPS O-acetylase OafA/YrhL